METDEAELEQDATDLEDGAGQASHEADAGRVDVDSAAEAEAEAIDSDNVVEAEAVDNATDQQPDDLDHVDAHQVGTLEAAMPVEALSHLETELNPFSEPEPAQAQSADIEDVEDMEEAGTLEETEETGETEETEETGTASPEETEAEPLAEPEEAVVEAVVAVASKNPFAKSVSQSGSKSEISSRHSSLNPFNLAAPATLAQDNESPEEPDTEIEADMVEASMAVAEDMTLETVRSHVQEVVGEAVEAAAVLEDAGAAVVQAHLVDNMEEVDNADEDVDVVVQELVNPTSLLKSPSRPPRHGVNSPAGNVARRITWTSLEDKLRRTKVPTTSPLLARRWTQVELQMKQTPV